MPYITIIVGVLLAVMFFVVVHALVNISGHTARIADALEELLEEKREKKTGNE